MTIALNGSFQRTVFAGVLAVVGTFASFTVTTTPVQAQAARSYTATLAAKLDAPKRAVLNGAVWRCKEQTCSGGDGGSSAVITCIRVVKEFGALSQFVTPKGDLPADKLARCNATAG